MTPGFDCAFATTAPHKATAIHRIFPIFIIFSFKSSFFNPFSRRSSEPPLPYRCFRPYLSGLFFPHKTTAALQRGHFGRIEPGSPYFPPTDTQRNARSLATFPAGQTLGIPSLPVRDDHPSAIHPRTADRAPSAACSGSPSQHTRRLLPSPRFYNVPGIGTEFPSLRPSALQASSRQHSDRIGLDLSGLPICESRQDSRSPAPFHLTKAFRTSNSGAHPVYDVLHSLKAVFYPARTRPAAVSDLRRPAGTRPPVSSAHANAPEHRIHGPYARADHPCGKYSRAATRSDRLRGSLPLLPPLSSAVTSARVYHSFSPIQRFGNRKPPLRFHDSHNRPYPPDDASGSASHRSRFRLRRMPHPYRCRTTPARSSTS